MFTVRLRLEVRVRVRVRVSEGNAIFYPWSARSAQSAVCVLG